MSRLTSQKGLDLVLEALPGLLEQGGQLALLGAGDPVLQEGFLAAAAIPGQVGVQIGYHEALRIALWAARTSFWCPAVLNRAA
ncbi:hypothetical protein ACNKHV_21550 [Shigella flexneri]